MKRAWLGLLVWLIASAAPRAVAAELEDLGAGLSYLRIRQLGEELPNLKNPAVVDLRYVDISASDAGTLPRLLQRSGPLRVVLLDASPPPELVAALSSRAPNVLTIAPAGARPAGDFELAVDPAEDRAAYNAFEAGTSLATLTQTGTDKPRLDEAALVRAKNGDGLPGHASQAADQSGTDSQAKPATDRLLQRALQLARGLQALNRAR